MADENNPSGQEENQDPKGTTPPDNSPDGSEKSKQISPEEQKRRDEQSQRDREAGKKDDTTERLAFLEARENERMRDSFVSELLSKEGETYPNVDPKDPMFKYASSEDEVKEIATELQNKYIDMKQKALSDVQTESDQGLSDEEIATKEQEMEEEVEKTGQSKFGSFIDNLGRRKH